MKRILIGVAIAAAFVLAVVLESPGRLLVTR